jgi:hypothetical protein
MRAFIAKHRNALLAALVVNGPQLWAGIKWFWDWAARLDLVVSHVSDLPKVGGMMNYLTGPPPWTVFLTSAIGIAIVLWDIRHPGAFRDSITATKNRMAFLVGAGIVCFVAAAAFGYAAYSLYKNPPPPAPAETELFQRAKSDFRINGGIAEQHETIDLTTITGRRVDVTIWIYSDLISMAKFLVFYIPQVIDMPSMPPLGGLPPHDMRMTYEAVKQMADRFPAIIKRVDMQGSAGTGDMGTDNWRYSTEAQFAGAIYIYYEGNLSEAEKVELRQLYKDRGARAFFRDRRYMIESRGPPQN